jgi:hypothetical protein
VRARRIARGTAAWVTAHVPRGASTRQRTPDAPRRRIRRMARHAAQPAARIAPGSVVLATAVATEETSTPLHDSEHRVRKRKQIQTRRSGEISSPRAVAATSLLLLLLQLKYISISDCGLPIGLPIAGNICVVCFLVSGDGALCTAQLVRCAVISYR